MDMRSTQTAESRVRNSPIARRTSAVASSALNFPGAAGVAGEGTPARAFFVTVSFPGLPIKGGPSIRSRRWHQSPGEWSRRGVFVCGDAENPWLRSAFLLYAERQAL